MVRLLPASVATEVWPVILESFAYLRANIFIVISINQDLFPLLLWIDL